jgi:hypothetical protein
MKFTAKVLSIPPYISTTWENISSLHVKEELGTYRLIVLLKDGPQVEIPNLDRISIEAIFNAHAQFSEERPLASQDMKAEDAPISFTLPLKGEGDGNVIEAFGPATQHNPEQADLPPLPQSVLKKIGAIASAFGVESLPSLPKAEPGCNCIYCQVMNAVQGESAADEEISEEDLKFRDWEVRKTADKLYIVTNPIDLNEHYSVFLGEPIGCTCGSKNCEHVRAVLNT